MVVDTCRQIVSFVAPELKRLWKRYPNIKIIIRGDSDFATPELYKLYEQVKADYVIRLNSNQRLQRIAREFEDLVTSEIDIYDDHHMFCNEFTYKAAS